MGVLEAGGALEHYTGLREELGRAEADVEMLKQKLATAERLDRTKTEQDLERTRLVKALRDDIHERDDLVREVILCFEEPRSRRRARSAASVHTGATCRSGGRR